MEIKASGEVAERDELLNGTQTVSFIGAADDGWEVRGAVSWNVGLVAAAAEGDITLTRDGSDIYGTATAVTVTQGDAEGAERFLIEYEIDGGCGLFENATGRATGSGAFRGDAFEGEWRVELPLRMSQTET